MPQPSNLSRIDAARAKQLDARRKMQALPKRPTRVARTNGNWHDHYQQREAK